MKRNVADSKNENPSRSLFLLFDAYNHFQDFSTFSFFTNSICDQASAFVDEKMKVLIRTDAQD